MMVEQILELFFTSKHFIINSILAGNITSLCPTLGKKYAQIHEGTCPVHLQKPANKMLPILFFGAYPFVKWPEDYGENIFGGSEFLVMKTLANKHKFTPKFHRAKNYAHAAVEVNLLFYICNTFMNFIITS